MTSPLIRSLRASLIHVTGLGAMACAPTSLYPTLPVTPAVSVDGAENAIAGRPLTLHFSWLVGPGFPALEQPHRVFVHFIDADGRLAFTDDHAPPVDIRQWRSGSRYEYVRRVILPDWPGDLSIRAGLFSGSFPYKATVTDGRSGAPGFPTVASIRVRENPALAEEAIAGVAGFDPWEADSRASLRSFRWAHRRGRFLFLQQAGGTVVLLQGFVLRERLPRDATVTLRVGGVQSSQVLTNDDRVLIELNLAGDGRTRLVEGEIESDASFTDGGREIAFCVERFRAVPLVPASRAR